jgi:hypothetical protein
MQTANVAMNEVLAFLDKTDVEYSSAVSSIYQQARSVSRGSGAGAFGVATGTFPVKSTAGRKIKFSGAIKTSDLTGGRAGLWWRADGPKGMLAFDNMQERGPMGTTAWTRYELVLEVPADTVNINFGMLMPGRGRAWFDDLQVEIDGEPYDGVDLFDFGFESGQIKGLFTPPVGYRVRIDNENASAGTRSLLIESPAADDSAVKTVDPKEASRTCGEVVARLEKARSEYVKRADAQTVDWAIQNARVAQQALQLVANEVPRDESMARNVKWILDSAPKGTRIVLWAHNGHVSRQRQGPFRAMGSYLDEWYGKDHVVVGFATNQGEYTAMGRGTGLGRHPLTKALPGSYEYVFGRLGVPRFILDLRASRGGDARSEWLRQPMQFRSIGALAMDQQFHSNELATLYDLMVFLDETTPTRGVPAEPPRR